MIIQYICCVLCRSTDMMRYGGKLLNHLFKWKKLSCLSLSTVYLSYQEYITHRRFLRDNEGACRCTGSLSYRMCVCSHKYTYNHSEWPEVPSREPYSSCVEQGVVRKGNWLSLSQCTTHSTHDCNSETPPPATSTSTTVLLLQLQLLFLLLLALRPLQQLLRLHLRLVLGQKDVHETVHVLHDRLRDYLRSSWYMRWSGYYGYIDRWIDRCRGWCQCPCHCIEFIYFIQ